MRIYRVHMDGYGDGYDDYETMEEAEQAVREWCAEYGEGEARVEVIEERSRTMALAGLPNDLHMELDNQSGDYDWESALRNGNETAAALIAALKQLEKDYTESYGDDESEHNLTDWEALEDYAKLFEPTTENLIIRLKKGLLDTERLTRAEKEALSEHWDKLDSPICDVWADYPRPTEEEPNNWEQEPSGTIARKSPLCGGHWLLSDDEYGTYIAEDDSLDIRPR